MYNNSLGGRKYARGVYVIATLVSTLFSKGSVTCARFEIAVISIVISWFQWWFPFLISVDNTRVAKFRNQNFFWSTEIHGVLWILLKILIPSFQQTCTRFQKCCTPCYWVLLWRCGLADAGLVWAGKVYTICTNLISMWKCMLYYQVSLTNYVDQLR